MRAQANTDPALNYRILRIAGEQFGCNPQDLNSQQRLQAEKIAANELQLEALVLQSSEARQVVVPEHALKASIHQLKQRYESEEQFEQALEDNQLDEENLSSSLHRVLKVDAIMEKVADSIVEPGETEARLFYYLHPDKFTQKESRIARHILITVNSAYVENTSEAVERRIASIAKRLKKNAHRFAEQALKHSECPTGMNGGSLGQVLRGNLYPELEESLFNLQEGEISEPVESELGWHILYCEKIIPEHILPLEEVLSQIRSQLTVRERKKAQRTWIKNLVEVANSERGAL